MQITTRSFAGKFHWPSTNVVTLLDKQLSIFFRSWGSVDYNQKLTDEISHYLATAQADIEVTSPFEYKENLSSLANKTRVSLLLAHDYFCKFVNKSEFTVGFEACVFLRNKQELAWASAGRFSLKKIHSNYLQTIFELGSDLDSQILLPADLLGAEVDSEIHAGSVNCSEQSQYVISSVFQGELTRQLSLDGQLHFLPTSSDTAYWYSVIKGD